MVEYIVLQVSCDDERQFFTCFEERETALAFYEVLKKHFPKDVIDVYIRMN